ncbi:MAG: hypothetical protein HDP34_05975 [Clostridia bacterium]|nr:hypothetical protein [Clostridia bacterium]
MKISAIDIGSNSVRLATCEGGKTLYKRLKTTRLGEGINSTGSLKPEAIERTAQAVADFVKEAKDSDKLYAFATAAVRSAENGNVFLTRVKELCGVQVEVLSGETEARCGLLGAVGFSDGGIIDVGGASTEVTVQCGGKLLYTKSVNIGTVRLFDGAGRNKAELLKLIDSKISEYGEFNASGFNMYAIGGTASRLASIKNNLTEYRPEITDGTVITLEEMYALSDKLLTLSVEQIRATTICGSSAELVGGGCLLMAQVMQKFGIERITVKESDNLEGYIKLKEERL